MTTVKHYCLKCGCNQSHIHIDDTDLLGKPAQIIECPYCHSQVTAFNADGKQEE